MPCTWAGRIYLNLILNVFLHQIDILSLIIKMYLELFFQYKHFLKNILYAHLWYWTGKCKPSKRGWIKNNWKKKRCRIFQVLHKWLKHISPWSWWLLMEIICDTVSRKCLLTYSDGILKRLTHGVNLIVVVNIQNMKVVDRVELNE